jgi:hypothetical protein
MRAVILLLLALTSCTPGGPPPVPDPDDISNGTTSADAWLPYIEEVQLPAVIYANEPIEIKRVVSSPLRPEILSQAYGPVVEYWPISDSGVIGYEIDGWLWSIPGTPSGNVYTSVLPGLPEGEWTIRIGSAKSPAEGGIAGRYMLTPSMQPLDEELMKRTDYAITVVARP